MDLFETNPDEYFRGNWSDSDASSSSSSSSSEDENEREEASERNSRKQERLKQREKRKSKREEKQENEAYSVQWTELGMKGQASKGAIGGTLIIGMGSAGAMYVWTKYLSEASASSSSSSAVENGTERLLGTVQNGVQRKKKMDNKSKTAMETDSNAKDGSKGSKSNGSDLLCNSGRIYAVQESPRVTACLCLEEIGNETAHQWADTLITAVQPSAIVIYDAMLSFNYYEPNNDVRFPLLRSVQTDAYKSKYPSQIPFLETANLVTGGTAAILTHAQVRVVPSILLLAIQEDLEVLPETILLFDQAASITQQLGIANCSSLTAPLVSNIFQILVSSSPKYSFAKQLLLNGRKLGRPTPESLYI